MVESGFSFGTDARRSAGLIALIRGDLLPEMKSRDWFNSPS